MMDEKLQQGKKEEELDGTPFDESVGKEESGNEEPKSKTLVRLRKTIVVEPLPEDAREMDKSVISPQFYNSFNYWLLPSDKNVGVLKFGVTSARAHDGKSLVASNLGVSFAVANEKKTLLVDLNMWRPGVDKIFGVRETRGFLDALKDPVITVHETQVKNLNVLTAGSRMFAGDEPPKGRGKNGITGNRKSVLGLERVTDFRDVIYSLEQEYEVIIFDLPPMSETELPRLYLKQIGGVIVVVNAGSTKKEEIDDMLQYVDESQILGFVLNRAR
jgi:protein-tyrosine kinase